MKLMDAIKNDIGKLKNIKVTPKGVKTAATIGGLIMFGLNAINETNERKAMKAALMNELGDEVVEKVMQKLSDTNKGS